MSTDQTQRRQTTAAPSDGLIAAAFWMYCLACLILAGAIVAGVMLFTHQVCGVNSFDPSLQDCSSYASSHPFRSAAVGVIVGGMVQAIVVAVIGRLCKVVGGMRSDR